MREIDIDDMSKCAGKSVRTLSLRQKTGSEIVAVKRGKYVLYNVLPDTVIFPGDTILLSGEKHSTDEAAQILSERESVSEAENVVVDAGELNIECLEVPSDSLLAGKTIIGANISKLYSVKVMGISRGGAVPLSRPSATDVIEKSNKIFLMGDKENIEMFREKFSLKRII